MLLRAARKLMVNSQIFISPLHLLDPTGQYLGLYEIAEALNIAQNYKTDLVLVTSAPASAILVDRRVTTKNKAVDNCVYTFDPSARTKTVIFSDRVETNAFERKIEALRVFLKQGNRCRIVLSSGQQAAGKNYLSSDHLLKRVSAEVRDVGIVHSFYQEAIGKIILDLWPCHKQ
jgi:translation initiation factor IF-3